MVLIKVMYILIMSILKDNDYIVEFENEIFSTNNIVEAEKNVIENINDKNYSIAEKFGFGQKDIIF